MALAYGIGGGAVVSVVAAILIAGWYWWTLWSAVLWLSAISVGLVGLLVVRTFVYRRADRLWERLEAYCDANDLEPELLREHYSGDELYEFFDALFELKERRERMRRGELPDGDD